MEQSWKYRAEIHEIPRIRKDLEILEVSNLLDETGQLHLDWELIETLWDAGGYRWDAETSAFVPLHEEL